MATATKQFIVTFPLKKTRRGVKSFFDLAKRHIIKGKKVDRNLSENIDEVLYEAYSLRN